MVGAAPANPAPQDNAFGETTRRILKFPHTNTHLSIRSLSALLGGAISTIVKDFKENHTDTTVLFTVTVVPGNSRTASFHATTCRTLYPNNNPLGIRGTGEGREREGRIAEEVQAGRVHRHHEHDDVRHEQRHKEVREVRSKNTVCLALFSSSLTIALGLPVTDCHTPHRHLLLLLPTLSPRDVLMAFYDVRVEYYGKRKSHLLSTLTDAWEKLDNKVRLI